MLKIIYFERRNLWIPGASMCDPYSLFIIVNDPQFIRMSIKTT